MKININKYIILTIIFYIITSKLVFAQTDEDELALLLNKIHTMQASFKQFMVNNKGSRLGQDTIGYMLLERPGKFLWEITQPNKQVITVNENKILIYDDDLNQVTKQKVNFKKSSSPAILLSSSTEELKKMFKVSKSKFSNKEYFELKPRNKNDQNEAYQWIKIYFNSDNQLKVMRIANSFGQFIEIYFYNIILNKKISQKKFLFVIPKNADVLEEN